MTAPGKNLEFFEGDSFRARVKAEPDLAQVIIQHVRDHFDRLERIEPGARQGQVRYKGQDFGFVILDLGRSRISLYKVWNADKESLDLKVLAAALKGRRKK